MDEPSIFHGRPVLGAGERITAMESMMDTNAPALTKQPSVWETPEFVEIRMDAEIGSYQDDFDGQDFH
jgi:hypothetical protein